jgi:hypothetical protein
MAQHKSNMDTRECAAKYAKLVESARTEVDNETVGERSDRKRGRKVIVVEEEEEEEEEEDY